MIVRWLGLAVALVAPQLLSGWLFSASALRSAI